MKKFFVFISMFCLSFGLFAFDWSDWINNLNLGLGIPVFKVGVSDSAGSSEMKGFGLGLDFKAQSIHEPSGFLLQAGLELGGLRVDDFVDGDPQWGFDFNAELGLGYAFVRNERAIASIAGVFGYDFSVLKKRYSYVYNYDIYNVELKALTMMFFAGFDFSGTLRISDSVGMYASCLIGLPLFGFGTESAKLGSRSATESLSVDFGGYYIKPSFGISFTLD